MHEVWKKVLDMVICLAILYCHLVCGGGKAKFVVQVLPMRIAKASRDIAPGSHKGGLQHPR